MITNLQVFPVCLRLFHDLRPHAAELHTGPDFLVELDPWYRFPDPTYEYEGGLYVMGFSLATHHARALTVTSLQIFISFSSSYQRDA